MRPYRNCRKQLRWLPSHKFWPLNSRKCRVLADSPVLQHGQLRDEAAASNMISKQCACPAHRSRHTAEYAFRLQFVHSADCSLPGLSGSRHGSSSRPSTKLVCGSAAIS
ncbi:hypothetical protein CDAR_408031 [Caerostris darwini]|uniref:Uncharacterized protein n=1 Tax=Caerostris darwini TaxID=1538125 RepID=A0AAV4PW79_9ARAC|nr:hypothetical protein CDAR_408031 [Caerostris darwini]